MEVATTTSSNAIDSYEDMFKEITRKLYGEDGLSEYIPTERLSNSQERNITAVDYEIDTTPLKPDEHITPFGLAALMQNSFPTTGILNSSFQSHKTNTTYEDKWIINEDNLQWTHSKIASYNPTQKLFRCAECDCVGSLSKVAEHWLGTHSNLRVFQCPQCPYESAWGRCVRVHLTRHHNINAEETTDALLKNNPVLHEVTRYLQMLKSRLELTCTKTQTHVSDEFQQNSTAIAITNTRNLPSQQIPVVPDTVNTSSGKRYACTYCPYATDRRDLFTRHENIHREEKPFQCYVCQKQFNRADHVKKHFLRMHREHPYDLNRIRRHPPKNASGMSYYHKYNSNGTPTQSPEPINNDITMMDNPLTIPNNFNVMSRTIPNTRTVSNLDGKSTNIKPNASEKGSNKKKGNKRFACCYCSWTGVDNWCLKRHMNTHLKPFICGLCDYKAARSERLSTHVLKVHNKRTCTKCSFLADDPTQLAAHQQDQHPLDQRNNRCTTNVLRTTTFNSTPTTVSSFSQMQSNIKPYELNTTGAILPQGNRLLQTDLKPWKSHAPKQHGAARLFNYMEASDSSEPECDSRSAEDINKIVLSHRIQSDFPEAGDVGIHLDESDGEDVELPLFVCKICGCEFEDDASLETHQYIHCHNTTSPAKVEDSKENVNPKGKYQCCLCEMCFASQSDIMDHMPIHSFSFYKSNNNNYSQDKEGQSKRSRKQSTPKKVVLPFLSNDEFEVLRDPNNKLWRQGNNTNSNLYDKNMVQMVTHRGYSCNCCRNQRLSQFSTRGSLILHKFWRNSIKTTFQCEHCNAQFRHRYQVVLHSSSVHITKPKIKTTSDKMHIVPIKEPIHSAVPVSEEITTHFLTQSFTTTVPEITSASVNVHKLGMSFFDHSFLHSNASINSHVPIIIPTFPPN